MIPVEEMILGHEKSCRFRIVSLQEILVVAERVEVGRFVGDAHRVHFFQPVAREWEAAQGTIRLPQLAAAAVQQGVLDRMVESTGYPMAVSTAEPEAQDVVTYRRAGDQVTHRAAGVEVAGGVDRLFRPKHVASQQECGIAPLGAAR